MTASMKKFIEILLINNKRRKYYIKMPTQINCNLPVDRDIFFEEEKEMYTFYII